MIENKRTDFEFSFIYFPCHGFVSIFNWLSVQIYMPRRLGDNTFLSGTRTPPSMVTCLANHLVTEGKRTTIKRWGKSGICSDKVWTADVGGNATLPICSAVAICSIYLTIKTHLSFLSISPL